MANKTQIAMIKQRERRGYLFKRPSFPLERVQEECGHEIYKDAWDWK